jgi:hypothetical protein
MVVAGLQWGMFWQVKQLTLRLSFFKKSMEFGQK